jgi:hypothetical protein
VHLILLHLILLGEQLNKLGMQLCTHCHPPGEEVTSSSSSSSLSPSLPARPPPIWV